MTVTENMATSIHSKDDDGFGISEYAMVRKTCRPVEKGNGMLYMGLGGGLSKVEHV